MNADETCRCEVLDPTTEGGGTDPRSCPVHAYEMGRRHERNVYLEERARLVAERDRLRERVQATADVGCVNSPAGRRYPMKCYPKDPCSFCRARALLDALSPKVVAKDPKPLRPMPKDEPT